MRAKSLIILIILTSWIFSQARQNPIKKQVKKKQNELKLTSSAFKEGEIIPLKYGCDGRDISPALEWSGVPENAKSLALIVDDPDAPAGTWVHWVIFNIPRDTTGLPEAQPADKELSPQIRQGVNDFKTIGYRGPCPPGEIHRYFFKLYALDTVLELAPGASKKQLLDAMKGHILSTAQLMGRYERD